VKFQAAKITLTIIYALACGTVIFLLSGQDYEWMNGERAPDGSVVTRCTIPAPADDMSDIASPTALILIAVLFVAGLFRLIRQRRIGLPSLSLGFRLCGLIASRVALPSAESFPCGSHRRPKALAGDVKADKRQLAPSSLASCEVLDTLRASPERRNATKRKVLTMVECGGRARSIKADHLNIHTVREILARNIRYPKAAYFLVSRSRHFKNFAVTVRLFQVF
jgi:hypothetical protein